MKIYKLQLPEDSVDKEPEIVERIDVPHDVSDPLEVIREAMSNLQDGEILRIVPAQGGDDYA